MSTLPTADCEQVLRVMFAYLDGEIDEEEGRTVSAHLERCRSCFSRAQFERELKLHVRELGREPVPPAFEERVRALIGQFGRG